MTVWKCRLTLLGSKQAMARCVEGLTWTRIMGARHVEWMELSPTRHVCEFSTNLPPVTQLEKVSHCWLRLTLLLDYEDETHRIKGLAKAKAGAAEHHWFRY